MSVEELLTTAEVAGLLKVRTAFVRQAVHDGRLKAFRVGTVLRIPASAVQAFLHASKSDGPDPRRDPRRNGRTKHKASVSE